MVRRRVGAVCCQCGAVSGGARGRGAPCYHVPQPQPLPLGEDRVIGMRWETAAFYILNTRYPFRNPVKSHGETLCSSLSLPRQTYFEDNPRDLQLLRHDLPLHPAVVKPHLGHVPDYLGEWGPGRPQAVGAVCWADGSTESGSSTFADTGGFSHRTAPVHAAVVETGTPRSKEGAPSWPHRSRVVCQQCGRQAGRTVLLRGPLTMWPGWLGLCPVPRAGGGEGGGQGPVAGWGK